MLRFDRYSHVNELLDHYISTLDRKDVAAIIQTGINSREQAKTFSR